jgi:hypothetical protein
LPWHSPAGKYTSVIQTWLPGTQRLLAWKNEQADLARKEQVTQKPSKNESSTLLWISRRFMWKATEERKGRWFTRQRRESPWPWAPLWAQQVTLFNVSHWALPNPQKASQAGLTEVKSVGPDDTANKGQELKHTSLWHISLRRLSAFNHLPSL